MAEIEHEDRTSPTYDPYELALHKLLSTTERNLATLEQAIENRSTLMEIGTKVVRLELEIEAARASAPKGQAYHQPRMKLRDITRFMEVQHKIAQDLSRTVYKAVTPMSREAKVGTPVHRIPSMVELLRDLALPDRVKADQATAILKRLPLGDSVMFYDSLRAEMSEEFMGMVRFDPPLELTESEYDDMEREDDD